jgi:hypothetical protein
MAKRLYRGGLFALYQLSLVLGILFLPLALGLRQVGVSLPFHRMVDRLGSAYDQARVDPA